MPKKKVTPVIPAQPKKKKVTFKPGVNFKRNPKNKAKQFAWNVVATNGNALSSASGYDKLYGAEKGICATTIELVKFLAKNSDKKLYREALLKIAKVAL